MPKPKRINLNNYQKVNKEEELEGFSSLIITPFKQPDGTQPPIVFLRRPAKGGALAVDIETDDWSRKAVISTVGSEAEYNKRVAWWIDNALKDPEYKQMVNDAFANNGFNLKGEFEKIKGWLLMCNESQRKSHVDKFVKKWLNKNYAQHLNKINRNK